MQVSQCNHAKTTAKQLAEMVPPQQPNTSKTLGLRAWGSGFRVQSSGFRVQSSGLGSGFRVQGLGLRSGKNLPEVVVRFLIVISANFLD